MKILLQEVVNIVQKKIFEGFAELSEFRVESNSFLQVICGLVECFC